MCYGVYHINIHHVCIHYRYEKMYVNEQTTGWDVETGRCECNIADERADSQVATSTQEHEEDIQQETVQPRNRIHDT